MLPNELEIWLSPKGSLIVAQGNALASLHISRFYHLFLKSVPEGRKTVAGGGAQRNRRTAHQMIICAPEAARETLRMFSTHLSWISPSKRGVSGAPAGALNSFTLTIRWFRYAPPPASFYRFIPLRGLCGECFARVDRAPRYCSLRDHLLSKDRSKVEYYKMCILPRALPWATMILRFQRGPDSVRIGTFRKFRCRR